jgi:nucleoid-associated protein YgaU
MAERNSTLVANSRYVAGGQTEVNTNALEWWERVVFKLDSSDTTYVVDTNTEGRLDLISVAFLGDSKLWWVLAQYNAILDPYNEITIGRVIRIPSKSRAQAMLSGKQGGYPSAREVPLSAITPIV